MAILELTKLEMRTLKFCSFSSSARGFSLEREDIFGTTTAAAIAALRLVGTILGQQSFAGRLMLTVPSWKASLQFFFF